MKIKIAELLLRFCCRKHVVIGGEVKSTAQLSNADYEKNSKDALAKIGYDGKSAFTKNNTYTQMI